MRKVNNLVAKHNRHRASVEPSLKDYKRKSKYNEDWVMSEFAKENFELPLITDTDRLEWIVENFVEFLPEGYDGCDYSRFDGFLKSDDDNFINAIDTEIMRQRGILK